MSRFFVLVGEDDGTGFGDDSDVPSRVCPALPGQDLLQFVTDDVSRPDAYWGTGDGIRFLPVSAEDIRDHEVICGWGPGTGVRIVESIMGEYPDGSPEPASWLLVEADDITDIRFR